MKRKREMGRPFVPTILADKEERKRIEGMGFTEKVRLKKAVYANVALKDGTVKKVKILRLVKNDANREFVRSNVITKGALVETELGLAKVTSRPNQDGVVNAVLMQ